MIRTISSRSRISCCGISHFPALIGFLLMASAILPGRMPAEEPVGRPLTLLEEEVRRRQVTSRTFDDEWSLLSRNFNTYRGFTDEEREKYRELYRSIQTSSERDALNSLLDRYYDWLEGLTPQERQSIRQAESPEKKLARIRELREQDEKQAQAEARATSALPKPERGKSRVLESNIDEEKLKAAVGPVFDIIESRMQEIGVINSEQIEAMKKLPAGEHHRKLILEYLPNRWRRTSERVFDGETRQKIAVEIEKQTGQTLPENVQVPKIVATAILQELRDEYRSAGSDPQKQKEFVERLRESLPPKERDFFDSEPESQRGKAIEQIIVDRVFKAFTRSNEYRWSPGDRPPPPPHDRGGPGPRREMPPREPPKVPSSPL